VACASSEARLSLSFDQTIVASLVALARALIIAPGVIARVLTTRTSHGSPSDAPCRRSLHGR
jgi:hypothetical protein